MSSNFGAYLSIFNDWDILPDALRTIPPYVQELVVVDGCYAWMLPYFSALGIDPEVSDPRVRIAIEASGIPARFINRVWRSEVEKRMAGYEAVTTRYVFRFDADEIWHVHEDVLARFLASGAAVAEMEMPDVAAPGLLRVNATNRGLGRQSMLFDKHQVDAKEHLHHLWLVLGTDQLPEVEQLRPRFPEPVAFNTHLTGWRTPETSVFRSAFYNLNFGRTDGVNWTEWFGEPKVRDLNVLFRDRITPAEYRDLLLTGEIVAGSAEPKGTMLLPSPYGESDEPGRAALYERFQAGLAALNRQTAAAGRSFVSGEYVTFDLTSEAAASALAHRNMVTLDIPGGPASCAATLYFELVDAPWERQLEIPAIIEGTRVKLPLPEAPDRSTYIRRALRFRIWCSDGRPVQRLTIVRD
jgi:hypothetical protein